MKIYEVVDRILAYHPELPNYHGCDSYKCGNPEEECTGIVTALVPNIDVIKKTAELGANLLIVHEPTFYTSMDGAGWAESFSNSVYEEKQKLLDQYGITIWRDHDHMHFHKPDGIFTGVLKYLGWDKNVTVRKTDSMFEHFVVSVPETTVAELCQYIMDTIGMNGLRYIGDPNARVSKLAFVGHLYPMPGAKKREDGSSPEYSVQIIKLLEEEVDVILPGEIIEWTVLSYIRDAVALGKAKAMLNIGHFNWEELGMKYAQEWVSDLVGDQLPVTYVPSGDMYRFELPNRGGIYEDAYQ